MIESARGASLRKCLHQLLWIGILEWNVPQALLKARHERRKSHMEDVTSPAVLHGKFACAKAAAHAEASRN